MKSTPLFLVALATLAGSAIPASAQRSALGARDAIQLVSSQYGPQAVQWIAELRAQGGVPQPSDWQILAYNERAPRLLYRFWAGGGRAGDGGIDEMRYPDDVPVGYFTASQISVDSVAAFTIAEGEARQARMAFDSCNYLLRLREYTTEPVWRLELLDATRRLVGKIYLSANSGQVLRTIWVYYNQSGRPDGQPRIVDSAAPGGQAPPLDFTGSPAPAEGGSLAGGIPSPPTYPAAGQVPGSMSGLRPAPAPPSPGVSIAGNPAYAPVDANGQPVMPAAPAGAASGIPSPPPLSPTVSPVPPAPPAATVPPAPSASSPIPAPAKPPVSSSSGAGSSDRIPPPPIP